MNTPSTPRVMPANAKKWLIDTSARWEQDRQANLWVGNRFDCWFCECTEFERQQLAFCKHVGWVMSQIPETPPAVKMVLGNQISWAEWEGARLFLKEDGRQITEITLPGRTWNRTWNGSSNSQKQPAASADAEIFIPSESLTPILSMSERLRAWSAITRSSNAASADAEIFIPSESLTPILSMSERLRAWSAITRSEQGEESLNAEGRLAKLVLEQQAKIRVLNELLSRARLPLNEPKEPEVFPASARRKIDIKE